MGIIEVLLAVAARVEVVRAALSQEVKQAEQAGSSKAAAVAGAQQLLAQATMIDDPSAGLLLLPGAVASTGGPQQGVSLSSSINSGQAWPGPAGQAWPGLATGHGHFPSNKQTKNKKRI
jgi:hypothetical protein